MKSDHQHLNFLWMRKLFIEIEKVFAYNGVHLHITFPYNFEFFNMAEGEREEEKLPN